MIFITTQPNFLICLVPVKLKSSLCLEVSPIINTWGYNPSFTRAILVETVLNYGRIWTQFRVIRAKKPTLFELHSSKNPNLTLLLRLPANMARWGLGDDPLCEPCGMKSTLAHIMEGCHTDLAQGTHRWRHDKVLAALMDILEQAGRRPERPCGATCNSSTVHHHLLQEGPRPASSRQWQGGEWKRTWGGS